MRARIYRRILDPRTPRYLSHRITELAVLLLATLAVVGVFVAPDVVRLYAEGIVTLDAAL